MIPAPVTRSATTVPGSGIAVGFTPLALLYRSIQCCGHPSIDTGTVGGGGTGSVIGAGDSISGTSCIGSAIDAGDSITGTSGTGSAIDAGDSTTGTSGTGSAMTGDGDSTIGTSGTGFVMTRGGWVVGDGAPPPQALEKFPDPHTYCAEAGGAAAT